MKSTILLVSVLAVATCAFAAQDTDILPVEVRDPRRLEAYLEANASDVQTRLAVVEASGGTTNSVTIQATKDLIAISDDGNTTNTVISDGVIDGEKIADDTIDDDSIDFADVTGADLTLTDCGVITSSGTVTAGGFTLTNGTTIAATLAGTTTITENNLAVVGAFTATSVGGITEGNLVDKTATEAVSGAWTFSGVVTISTNIVLAEITAPATPATNKCVIFLDAADGDLKVIDDNGETITIGNITED